MKLVAFSVGWQGKACPVPAGKTEKCKNLQPERGTKLLQVQTCSDLVEK